MNVPLPAAVLWDMDGTLVDTEPLWQRFSHEIVEEAGGVLTPEDARRIQGAGIRLHGRILAASAPQLEAEAAFHAVEDRVCRAHASSIAMPGALDALDLFRSLNIPQYVISASSTKAVSSAMRALGREHFAGFISDEAGLPSKPAPDPYLEGARRLGVRIRDCVIFEDSANGLAAARASGAAVWDVNDAPLTALTLEKVRLLFAR